MRIALATSFVLAALLAAGCSNAAATCQADCESRVDRCDLAIDCPSLCNTYIALGDPAGCSDERQIYQSCVVDNACTDDCGTALGNLNQCVARSSNDPCVAYCRSRDAAGCGNADCATTCINAEYLGRAAGCESEVDLWVNCLTTGSQCDADSRCASLGLDALGCFGDFCNENPDDDACEAR